MGSGEKEKVFLNFHIKMQGFMYAETRLLVTRNRDQEGLNGPPRGLDIKCMGAENFSKGSNPLPTVNSHYGATGCNIGNIKRQHSVK